MAIEYLSDLEEKKLATFCEDTVMFEAVRKVLLDGIYNNGVMNPGAPAEPRRNWALSVPHKAAQGIPMSDAEIGAEMRACYEGIQFLEKGFAALSSFKEEKPEEKEPENKAL